MKVYSLWKLFLPHVSSSNQSLNLDNFPNFNSGKGVLFKIFESPKLPLGLCVRILFLKFISRPLVIRRLLVTTLKPELARIFSVPVSSWVFFILRSPVVTRISNFDVLLFVVVIHKILRRIAEHVLIPILILGKGVKVHES